MTTEAATPAGAETSVPADSSAAQAKPELSIKDRIKAHLAHGAPHEPAPDAERKAPGAKQEATAPVEQDEPTGEQEAEPNEQVEGDDAPIKPLQSIRDLAEQTGLELDALMDLDLPTKIDGKEGKARLRDLIKSYQLESHLTNKLTAYADEKKAHETQVATYQQQKRDELTRLHRSAQVAQRLMDGEFSQVNWQELQASDPNAFNAKVVEYQHRKQAIDFISQQIDQESKAANEAVTAQQQAYLSEQSKLLDSKIPEWADSAKRAKDVAELATVSGEAYGLTDQEVKSITDHRQILVLRDAVKWQQLQKSKPELLQKVRTAPKLVKPGSPMSQGTKDLLARKHATDKLRQSGSVKDATPLLKQLLFRN